MNLKNMHHYWAIIINLVDGKRNLIKYLTKTIKKKKK